MLVSRCYQIIILTKLLADNYFNISSSFSYQIATLSRYILSSQGNNKSSLSYQNTTFSKLILIFLTKLIADCSYSYQISILPKSSNIQNNHAMKVKIENCDSLSYQFTTLLRTPFLLYFLLLSFVKLSNCHALKTYNIKSEQ